MNASTKNFKLIQKLKKLQTKVYQYHRKPGYLLAPLAKISNWYENQKPLYRKIILSVATLLIILYSTRIVVGILEKIQRLFEGGAQHTVLFCLAFSDSLVCLGLISAILILLFLFSGTPVGKSHFPPFLNGRPVVTFILCSPLIFLLFTFAPTVITDLIMQYRSPEIMESWHRFFPNMSYVKETLIFSILLALSFADISADPKAVRWWSIPFPLLGSPILLWNFIAGWLPSRWWSVWRPILAVLSFIMFLSTFTDHQPIRQTFPMFNVSNVSEIPFSSAYQILRLPDKQEAYLTGNQRIAHIARSESGTWEVINQYDFPFQFNEISVDYQKEVAYIFDGFGRKIVVFDLKNFSIRESHAIPLSDCPSQEYEFKLAFDPDICLLALLDRNGNCSVFDLNSYQIRNRLFFHNHGPAEAMHYDRPSGLLYILTNLKLFIYRFKDMALIQTIPFDQRAGGMVLDRARNRILICFPSQLTVIAYDLKSLMPVSQFNSPAATRLMAIDEKNDLLFLNAMTGMQEILDATTYAIKSKQRVATWIHGMQIFPENNEAILLPGSNAVQVWSYQSPTNSFDFGFYVLEAAENLLTFLLDHNWVKVMPMTALADPGRSPDVPKAKGTILQIEPNSEFENSARVILQTAGYRVLSISNKAEILNPSLQKQWRPDIILLDESVADDKNMVNNIEAIWPNTSIIRTIESYSNEIPVGAQSVYKPYSPKFFLETIQMTFLSAPDHQQDEN